MTACTGMLHVTVKKNKKALPPFEGRGLCLNKNGAAVQTETVSDGCEADCGGARAMERALSRQFGQMFCVPSMGGCLLLE